MSIKPVQYDDTKWKLVPVIPTPEMGMAVHDIVIKRGIPLIPPSVLREIYDAWIGIEDNEEVSLWRPIASAPKDGTPVLCLWDKPKDSIAQEGTEYAIAIYLPHEASWACVDDDDVHYSDPIYWMPLPASPTPSNSSGG